MQRLAVSTKNQQSTELKSDGMFSVTLNRCWFSVNFFALIFLELIYYLLTFRHGRKKRYSVLICFTPENTDHLIRHINWLHILAEWKCRGECWHCQVLCALYRSFTYLSNELSRDVKFMKWFKWYFRCRRLKKNIMHPMSFNAINAKNDLFIPGGIITYTFQYFLLHLTLCNLKIQQQGDFLSFLSFLLPQEMYNSDLINLAYTFQSNFVIW